MKGNFVFKKVFVREKYLSKIRPFYESDVIKVITGVRRCGKSFVLKSIINELIESGISNNDIVYIPLDMRGYKSIKASGQLENKIEECMQDANRKFIFIDEVQNVKGFEEVVQSYAEEGHSLFITGSNSYLLSGEISTKLTGRYLNFEVYTLDFREYLAMKEFWGLSIDPNITLEFDSYIINGGFPKGLEFQDEGSREFYTRGVIEEIFKKDVKSRNKITNVALFERVQSHIINNYSAPFSLKSLCETLKAESLSFKPETVRKYIADVENAKLIYECNRFDLKSKRAIAREQKFYLADLSIYFAMNTDNRLSYGPSLENLVYLYMLGKGFRVSVGKIGHFECDFIVRGNRNEYAYVQVAYTLQGENADATDKIVKREFAPFTIIKDAYPRIIITLDTLTEQREGVKHLNAIDLFLGKVSIF